MIISCAEPVLLEREEHLTALRDALATVRRRKHGAVVLVEGEAGAGKSELVRCFCERTARSARILWGGCDALFTPRPLGPLLDIAESAGGELQAQVAAGAPPHDVASALLRELARPAPTVLVLEDLHWADEATLDVVRLAIRRVEAVATMLVLSFREEQVDRRSPLRLLLGELPRRPWVTRLQVGGLSREAVATLAEPAAIDPDDLYVRTGGNPFFVTEVLAAGTQHLPSSVRDAVLARCGRLGSQARSLLEAVAVVPQRTELWLLDRLGDFAPDAMEECLSSGMLRADGNGVAFRHELARVAVEESLSPIRRASLHRAALAALAEMPYGAPDFARLAHHAEAVGDAESVLRHSTAAAEHAASVGAHRESRAQYQRALRFASGIGSDARADLLERFAAQCYLTDMRTGGIEALEQAAAIRRSSNDVVGLSAALRLKARLLGCTGRGFEASAAIDEAVAVLAGTAPGPELARAYAAKAADAMVGDEHDEAIDWGNRAIALAEAFGDTQALVSALNSVGASELQRGSDAGREKLERSLALARDHELLPEAGRAYINVVDALARTRDWQRAEAYLSPGIEYCREHGLEAWEDCLWVMRAESYLARGRWSEGADLAARILAKRPEEHALPRCSALCVLGLVRARRGDPGRWAVLDEALAIARADGELQTHAMVAAARAEAAWLEGRGERVEAETADALALALERREPWSAGELALWRRRAGVPCDLPDGLAGGPLALELAGNHRAASEAWRERGLPYEAALAGVDAGDEQLLRQAHAALRELGARPAAAIVARRLRALGARNVPRGPYGRARDNPAGLTARELEVLVLLADGLRNGEISSRLVVSEKTVDHHVSAILRKLGVRNRGQAGAQAARLGLLHRAAG